MAVSMAVAMALAVPCASAAFLYLPPDETSVAVSRAVGSDIGSTAARRPEDPTVEGDVTVSPLQVPVTTTGARQVEPANGGAEAAAQAIGLWRIGADETLREILERWGERAGVEVLFLTDRRYRLHEARVFEGKVHRGGAGAARSACPSAACARRRGEAGRAHPRGVAPGAPGRRAAMRAGRVIARFLAALALAATVLPAIHAAADEWTVAGAIDEPAMVAALRANGARVLALGKQGGLDGHFVELADGDAYSLYVTPDGHAVAGLLYAPDGSLVTGRQIAAARGGGVGGKALNAETLRSGPGSGAVAGDDAIRLAHGYQERAAAHDADALFEQSGAAFGFTLGQSGPLVVLFADPGCRWSRSAAARLGKAAIEGRLRLRVVPVGVLGATSAREAAAIASDQDTALAWFEGAGAQAGPEGGRRIAGNNALYDRWGADAVPLIVWRGADGRIARHPGDVDDIDLWLEALPHE